MAVTVVMHGHDSLLYVYWIILAKCRSLHCSSCNFFLLHLLNFNLFPCHLKVAKTSINYALLTQNITHLAKFYKNVHISQSPQGYFYSELVSQQAAGAELLLVSQSTKVIDITHEHSQSLNQLSYKFQPHLIMHTPVPQQTKIEVLMDSNQSSMVQSVLYPRVIVYGQHI